MKQIRNRLTYANVMSSIAVFLVLGGATAFAASELGKNSVGTKQLKKEAVTLSKIKKAAKNSLKGATGPTGPQGAKGDPGANGTALAFARVEASGIVDADNSKGVVNANVTHPSTGVFCFSGLSPAPKNVVVTAQFFEPAAVTANAFMGDYATCPAGTQVSVHLAEGATERNSPFTVLFN